MKKETKKILTYTIIGILVLGVVGVLVFQTKQSFFPADYTDPDTLSVSQVSSNANYYVYSFSASPYYSLSLSNADGNSRAKSQPLDQTISFSWFSWGNRLAIPSDIQLNRPFNATVTIQGTGGYFQPGYGYATSEVGLKFENVTSTCTAVNSGTVTCNVKGIASMQDSSLSGTFSLLNANFNFQSTFLKQGVQCLDNSYCSNGLVCQNTQCVTISNPTPTENTTTNYTQPQGCSIAIPSPPSCSKYVGVTDNNGCFQAWSCQDNGTSGAQPSMLPFYILIGITLSIVILLFLKKKKRHPRK